METRTLLHSEKILCAANLRSYMADFRHCSKKCKNCSYPISALEGGGFYSLHAEGVICNACHTMEDAVNQQPGLRHAHAEWQSLQKKMNRLKSGGEYFN